MIPDGRPLHTVASKTGSRTGSGSTTSIIVTKSPKQPNPLTGTMSYSTVIEAEVRFVNISPEIAFEGLPLPTGSLPIAGVRPTGIRMPVML